jgi:uncharacterized membrane protein (DUF2068 family)
MATRSPLVPIAPTASTASPPRHRRDRGLAAIAIFKACKAILLVLAWLGTREILRQDVAERARQWLAALSFTTGPRFVRQGLAWASGVSDARLRQLGLVALAFATLYCVEGIGLWLERRWAEYLTIVATGSLIPFELYELARGISGPKMLAFTVNVAVVAYLVYLLRRARGTLTGAGA